MKLFDKSKPLTIVCYGDSNTKYYLGDLQQDGPHADSYPARLQKRFADAGFDNVRVLNCGFPDTQTDFALEHFWEQVVENKADICIFGFGTNCVRQEDADLDSYIEDMSRLMGLCELRGIQPMSLLIPWYSEDYCGKAGQDRLPGWNGVLCELCMSCGAPVIDTFHTFAGAPQLYFNEVATPKRHYSPLACQTIADMVFAMIAPSIR